MAASPVPPPQDDAPGGAVDPLAHAVRARLAPLGRYGEAVLVQARHDGGPDRFAYEWEVSAGDILWQERDLLLWLPPSLHGEHHLQVAVVGEDAAAVASCRLRSEPLRGQG